MIVDGVERVSPGATSASGWPRQGRWPRRPSASPAASSSTRWRACAPPRRSASRPRWRCAKPNALTPRRGEQQARTEWLIEQRRAAPEQGPLAVRRAQLEGELAAERRQAEQAGARTGRAPAPRRAAARPARRRLRAGPRAERLAAALSDAGEAVESAIAAFEPELAADRAAGEEMAAELSACAGEEAEIQARAARRRRDS